MMLIIDLVIAGVEGIAFALGFWIVLGGVIALADFWREWLAFPPPTPARIVPLRRRRAAPSARAERLDRHRGGSVRRTKSRRAA
jgi:hypothetical protein